MAHTVHEGQRIKALEENIAEDEPNERQNEENIVNANKYRSRTEKKHIYRLPSKPNKKKSGIHEGSFTASRVRSNTLGKRNEYSMNSANSKW